MKYIVCDICKRTVEKPIKDRTLFHLTHFDICGDCADELDMNGRRRLRKSEAEHRPFDFQWYNDYLVETITKSIQRGKVDKA